MGDFCFSSADILMPKKDLEKWSVIACDQFTSEGEYWSEVENNVGEANSSLRIVLPEIYLEDDRQKRIDSINDTMRKYLEEDVFYELQDAMIYVERLQSDGHIRHGVIGAITLSDYDYMPGSKALIRATEQTVIERIPPRVMIRKDASIELPHVMLMVDDRDKKAIEPFSLMTDKMQLLYDFELMQGGGHIKGWLIDKESQTKLINAFKDILSNSEDKMLFAVGDGNHSLATAKECSLNASALAQKALVEVVNIHDDAISFEPIYRVLFDVEPQKVIADMKEQLGVATNGHEFTVVFNDCEEKLIVPATSKLPVGTLQVWLDKYIKENDIKIDYVHGIDSVKNIVKANNTVGFIFDGMKKEELFDAVKQDGSLPRKTFSMGKAVDKRYYLEGRKLF